MSEPSEELTTLLSRLVNSDPEIQLAVLSVAWSEAGDQRPTTVLMARNGYEVSTESLMRALRQVSHTLDELVNLLKERLSLYDEYASVLATDITGKRAAVEQLDRQIEELSNRVDPDTGASAPGAG
jgi:predicted RecB family endonuclease